MRKSRKVSFEELVVENKREILNNKEELSRIEERLEGKRVKK
ncbi:FbpB family small basic protein [Caldalkalibacillus salinus]|nr:FbpB family small basic protein [Caldalkalibacillus salinus]